MLVISKFKNINLNYRKLKVSDYSEFKKLFYLCFKKKISFKFFKWRYFNNRSSFCYGAFSSSKLIANVGMVSIKLNNNEEIFSRHSSMVLKKYRGIGIFSNLLEKVKTKISKKINLIIMWPNNNNHSNFGIEKKKIIKKKYYLYKTLSSKKLLKKIKNYPIDDLNTFKNFIKNNKNNLFFKNFDYFKKRYISYQKNEYLINKFQFKKFTSFFIIKYKENKSDSNYVILDHFGSKEIVSKHLSYLLLNQNKLIFLSKKKLNRPNYELLSLINFKIGFIKKFNVKQKKFFLDQDIYLGDTDIFITT